MSIRFFADRTDRVGWAGNVVTRRSRGGAAGAVWLSGKNPNLPVELQSLKQKSSKQKMSGTITQ